MSMRSVPAHASAYHAAPGLNWQRPLALVGALAFSVLAWVGIGWAISNLF